MPRLSAPVVAKAGLGAVRFEADKAGGESVGHLTKQHHVAGERVLEQHNAVQVDEQIREPHGGAQVVEHMSDAVGELSGEAELIANHFRLLALASG